MTRERRGIRIVVVAMAGSPYRVVGWFICGMCPDAARVAAFAGRCDHHVIIELDIIGTPDNSQEVDSRLGAVFLFPNFFFTVPVTATVAVC